MGTLKGILKGLGYFASRVWDSSETYPVTSHEYTARHAKCLEHVRHFNEKHRPMGFKRTNLRQG